MGDAEEGADEGTEAEEDEAAAIAVDGVEGSVLVQLMEGPLATAG